MVALKRYFIIFCIFIFGLSIYSLAAESKPALVIFYSPMCGKCIKLKHDFMPRIERKYADRIDIRYLNIDDIQNYKLLLSYEEKYGKVDRGLPIIFMEGKFLSGETQTERELEKIILIALKQEGATLEEKLPIIDLVAKFKSFSLLAIIFAGLVDGVNPCAFTVIVFFVGFLTLQKYKKKEIIISGVGFIFAVFLTYFLLGLGLFRALYSLKLFYFISKSIYLLIALMAFALGIITVFDIIKFRATHRYEDISLRLPERVKYYIHYIIGSQYRPKNKEEQEKKGLFRLTISAIFAGGFVSLLEAVCTGQIYLPTLTFVLKISQLKFQAITYLAIYNLMFIIPLILVFLFGVLGTTSKQFSNFMQKHIVVIKILMAGLFFGLGLTLIWKV